MRAAKRHWEFLKSASAVRRLQIVCHGAPFRGRTEVRPRLAPSTHRCWCPDRASCTTSGEDSCVRKLFVSREQFRGSHARPRFRSSSGGRYPAESSQVAMQPAEWLPTRGNRRKKTTGHDLSASWRQEPVMAAFLVQGFRAHLKFRAKTCLVNSTC